MFVDCLKRPNGLGISGGAPIDREGFRAESRFQNGPDLVAAKRRRLHARVGPPSVRPYTSSVAKRRPFDYAISARNSLTYGTTMLLAAPTWTWFIPGNATNRA